MLDPSAASFFAAVRDALKKFDCRTSVTRSGEPVLTFIRDRRYAILTADADGDMVLTLTDRAATDEADAEVVNPDVGALADRIRGYLEQ